MMDEFDDLLNNALATKPAKQGVNANNVGNIRPVGKSTGFQQMDTPESGIKAIDENLKTYGEKHGINTLRGVISRWAPPSENDTESYIKSISQKTGLKPDEKIDLSDPVVRHILSGPIILQEKGLKHIVNKQPSEQPTQPTGDEFDQLLSNAQPVTKEPSKFSIEKLTEPLKTMSVEDWKKHSILGPLTAYREHRSPETAQALIDAVTPIAQGIKTAVTHPIDTATAIAKSLYENPLGAVGEAVKSTIYDPEQLLAGLVPKAGVAEAGAKAITRTAKEARELAPKELSTMQTQFEAKKGALGQQIENQFGQKTAGAAEVKAPTQRIQAAQELPIPIDLSKDQITRNPADVRFARETAKDPVLGQKLQEHYAGQNLKIQQNLDHLVEETGAELTGVNPSELSKKLIETVQPARMARKKEYDLAYQAARQSGETAQPINIETLKNYAANHEAEAINAPIISSLELKLKNLAKEGNEIPLNDLEEVRKMVTRLSDSTPTNAKFGREIKGIIDNLTKNAGGEKYQNARKLFRAFETEFEDTPILKQITALKKGTTQRSVAMQDLIDKSIVNAPLEEVQKLYGSLQKMGEPGEAMIKELNGYMAQRIKNEATKGVQLDINGKPYVSTPKLNSIINDLDTSGKLDFMFGKKNAEHYRTLNEVTKNIQTVPQGTTNPSGTASSILAALGEMGAQTALTGVPVPVAMIGKHLYGKHQVKKNLNKISEFIDYGKGKK